ncbi:MAG: molybdate ABC transporter permease subunit, partial [Acidimicrobiia bacterium]|nr:molybdate ABC transporter permease subunit [Acidimicrobiia bacterium]
MRRVMPLRLGVLAGIGLALLVVPIAGLLIRVPWSGLGGDLAGSGDAVRVSIVVSVLATTVAVGLGVPLAWLLARGSFRGQALLRATVLLPIVLPAVVSGVALLASLGRSG